MERLKKIALFLLKILKWPAIYLSVPVVVSIGFHFIMKLVGSSNTISDTFGNYALVLAGLIILFVIVASVVTSTFFTEYFLASTGIAALVYLLTSLFIKAQWSFESLYEFDTIKMYVFALLVVAVLIGDIIVLIARRIGRNIRNKKLSK